MPYVIDRQHALRLADVVAIVRGSARRIRSQVVLRDNSLYQTLTRPRTLLQHLRGLAAIIQIGSRRRRGPRHGIRRTPP